MKCQILFSRKNKKNIISLLSAQFAHNMVSFKFPDNKMATYCNFIRELDTKQDVMCH